jgi:hypothetical protein
VAEPRSSLECGYRLIVTPAGVQVAPGTPMAPVSHIETVRTTDATQTRLPEWQYQESDRIARTANGGAQKVRSCKVSQQHRHSPSHRCKPNRTPRMANLRQLNQEVGLYDLTPFCFTIFLIYNRNRQRKPVQPSTLRRVSSDVHFGGVILNG